MPKNPLFASYKQGENRVTASMLSVFERVDHTVLERLLRSASEESSLTFVSFTNQLSEGGGSVPDAEISAAFRYLFEVKTEIGAVREKQLKEHLEHLGGFGDEWLFVLTPDPEEPSEVAAIGDDRVLWFHFRALTQAIDELLGDPSELIAEQARFLLHELRRLFEEEGLLSHVDVVIVPAKNAYQEYVDHSAYVCQPNRSFRDGLVRMGFYRNNRIERPFPKIEWHDENVRFTYEHADEFEESGSELERRVADLIRDVLDEGARTEGSAYGVFLLSSPDDDGTLALPQPIENTKFDKNGKPFAWTMMQRYVTEEALRQHPTTTDELDALVAEAS